MAKLIVEVLNRLGHVTERYKVDLLPVRIGRGYHNDIILTDPHVSPEHLILHEADDGWRAEDCDSHNGIQIKHHSDATTPDHVKSGDDITLGKTKIRLYSPWHPVPETHITPTGRNLEKLIGHPTVVTFALALTLLTLVVNKYLHTATSVSIEKLIASVLPVIVGILIWAGGWAFAGRVMKHRANFLSHFSITTLFAFSLIIINTVGEYVAFATNSALVPQIVEFILMGLALLALFNVNIDFSTSATRKTRLVMSHSLTWGFLVFAVFMDYANKPDFRHSPSFTAILKPPFAKVTTSKSAAEFLEESKVIFEFEDRP